MAIKVTSKCEGITDEEWKQNLLLNDTCIHLYSGLKYKELFKDYTYYNIYDSCKSFMVFKDVDSLYRSWYNNNPFNEKMTTVKETIDTLIDGYKCYKLIIASKNTRSEFIVLDSSLYDNGKYVYLNYYYENPFYSFTSKAISIDEKQINSEVFVYPPFPLSQFKNGSFSESRWHIPEFKEGDKGWLKFISRNARPELGCANIKIPKNQKVVIQSISVVFALDCNGNVVKSVAINSDDIQPELVKEAIRVIYKSPTWNNATYHDKPIPFIFTQRISFACSDE